LVHQRQLVTFIFLVRAPPENHQSFLHLLEARRLLPKIGSRNIEGVPFLNL
jgi:hypothetical protein